MKGAVVTALISAIVLVLGTVCDQGQFIAGADMSLLPFFEARGVRYQDAAGQSDALATLRVHGVNCVRLRLFTSSASQAASDPYNYANNLEYTVALAQRVKHAGLQLILDFHFSDTWADPAHQTKPAAWQNLSFTSLVQQVQSYSSNCLVAFKAAGAAPDFVQLGNEITAGLLWPDGRVGGSSDTPAQWLKLAELLNAAIEGIRTGAGAPAPKLIVHIDRGADWGGTQWFFDNLLQRQVPFDIIGETYYPFWHGPLSDVSHCLTNAALRYRRPILIAETAFPWTGTTNVYEISPTPQGQVQYVAALAQIVKSLPHQLGLGVAWWGAEYQHLAGTSLAGFDRSSFFGSDGSVLPVADAFGQLLVPIVIKARLSGGDLKLQWPLSGAGLTLTANTNFGSNTWTPVSSAIENLGLSFGATLPSTSNPATFYRLQAY